MTLRQFLSPAAASVPVSALEAIADYGRDRAGIIPLWAGEGDLATPDFICAPTHQSLTDGETFYTWQNGMMDLRAALARYHTRHFGKSFDASEFIVTMGGMHAICLALQATSGKGDEAIYLSPAWPNFAEAARISGVEPVAVPMTPSDGGWSCDLDRLAAAVTPRTRAIFVNSPSNPTGWVADHATLQAILVLARQHNLWIIADEIYALFTYSGTRAPSFFDVATSDDRILFVNSFSKNWAMTGWRIGWMRVPPSLGRTFANLVQYSTSGVPAFLQRGAVAALDEGDSFVSQQVARAKAARDHLCRQLSELSRTRFAVPEGAFYLFFSIEGMTDSRAAALDLIDKTGVGVAPGIGFGEAGEGFLRLCFHRDLAQIRTASERLAEWLASYNP